MKMIEKLLSLSDHRKTNLKQLWCVGCSFAHGSSISKQKRFGKLLGDKLELPVSFLTCPGSSIQWAADQILRSDIRENDIVVWALTGSARLPFVDHTWQLNHITATNFQNFNNRFIYFKEQLLVSNHMIYDSIVHVEQVINFSNKINFELILCLMPCNLPIHNIEMEDYIGNLPNGLLMYNSTTPLNFIDYGDDKLHPGPMQHQIYCNQIIEFYENLRKNIST